MPLTDFTQVKPGEVYTAADVASLLKVKRDAVHNWIEQGMLPALPRMLPKSRYRILGATILSLFGVPATPTDETPEQRAKRAAADLDAIRRMKHAPGTGA